MSKTIRAICSDIDGTLLDSRRELSERTIDSIRRIKDKVPVILASSRMPAAMRHLQAQLDITDHPLICYNGGYVIQYLRAGEVRVIDTVSIPLTVAESILKLTQGTSLHTSLYHADEWYAPGMDQWAERESRITKVSPVIRSWTDVVNAWKKENKGVHKIMCMGDEQEIDPLEKVLSSQYADHVHAYRSKATYLEISPRSVSKATSLTLLIHQLYGLDPADVMAFGDNYNDIDMLKTVGLGIAVDNARPEVKAIVRETTLSNILDGVAISIDTYFER